MPLNTDDFKCLVEVPVNWSGWRLERDCPVFTDPSRRPSPPVRDALGQVDPVEHSHNSAAHTVFQPDHFEEDDLGRDVTHPLIGTLKSDLVCREQFAKAIS